jgi:hypothetical protein
VEIRYHLDEHVDPAVAEGLRRRGVDVTTEVETGQNRAGSAVEVHRPMPTVLLSGPYRVFFVSQDSPEPPHVHVQRDKMVAKFWLDPVSLQKAGGFRSHELNRIGKLVQQNRVFLLERWHEYFGE